MKKFINVIDVTLRDGIQSQKKILSSHEKFTLINNLIRSGVRNLEVTSFVNTNLVPQFNDNKHIVRNLVQFNGVVYSALVPNLKGYNTLRETMDNEHSNIREIVLFVSASETFNKKNINSSLKEAFDKFKEISLLAKEDGIKIRGSISCCFTCPYEGEVTIDKVNEVIKRYVDIGVDMIDIADTLGNGSSIKLMKILDEGIKHIKSEKISGHFHDALEERGNALSLVETGLIYGMDTFHSSMMGTGGCPFSNRIVGNLSTEKLVDYLHKNGYETGIRLPLNKG